MPRSAGFLMGCTRRDHKKISFKQSTSISTHTRSSTDFNRFWVHVSSHHLEWPSSHQCGLPCHANIWVSLLPSFMIMAVSCSFAMARTGCFCAAANVIFYLWKYEWESISKAKYAALRAELIDRSYKRAIVRAPIHHTSYGCQNRSIAGENWSTRNAFYFAIEMYIFIGP